MYVCTLHILWAAFCVLPQIFHAREREIDVEDMKRLVLLSKSAMHDVRWFLLGKKRVCVHFNQLKKSLLEIGK